MYGPTDAQRKIAAYKAIKKALGLAPDASQGEVEARANEMLRQKGKATLAYCNKFWRQCRANTWNL